MLLLSTTREIFWNELSLFEISYFISIAVLTNPKWLIFLDKTNTVIGI